MDTRAQAMRNVQVRATVRVQNRIVTCAALWIVLTFGAAGAQAYQPQHEPNQQAAAEGHTAEGEHEEGLMPTVARIANFAILVGILVYFLKSPIAGYLQSRSEHIRSELVQAADMRRASEAQLAEVNRRMEALPAELDALRARGAADIAAEETRIRAAAESERGRLLEQMHREVEMQVRVAQTMLRNEAANLATSIARRRIEHTITPADQMRLVDRYAAQLGAAR
jgi:F-type H+-transporting ATPase subunit b